MYQPCDLALYRKGVDWLILINFWLSIETDWQCFTASRKPNLEIKIKDNLLGANMNDECLPDWRFQLTNVRQTSVFDKLDSSRDHGDWTNFKIFSVFTKFECRRTINTALDPPGRYVPYLKRIVIVVKPTSMASSTPHAGNLNLRRKRISWDFMGDWNFKEDFSFTPFSIAPNFQVCSAWEIVHRCVTEINHIVFAERPQVSMSGKKKVLWTAGCPADLALRKIIRDQPDISLARIVTNKQKQDLYDANEIFHNFSFPCFCTHFDIVKQEASKSRGGMNWMFMCSFDVFAALSFPDIFSYSQTHPLQIRDNRKRI